MNVALLGLSRCTRIGSLSVLTRLDFAASPAALPCQTCRSSNASSPGNVCVSASAAVWKSLLKADTSLVRLSAEPGEEEEEEETTCLDAAAVPRLGSGLQPLGSLPCSAVDPALAKSLESVVNGFSRAALNAQTRQNKGPSSLVSVSESSHLSALREVFENGAQISCYFPNTLPALCLGRLQILQGRDKILHCSSTPGSQSILRPGSARMV